MKLHDLLERYEGEKNSNFKGKGKRGERAEHLAWVKIHGPASAKDCRPVKNFRGPNHQTKAVDWAQIRDGGWKPMCRSCHNTYDGKINNIKHMKK